MKRWILLFLLFPLYLLAQPDKQFIHIRVHDLSLSVVDFEKKYSVPIMESLKTNKLGKITNAYQTHETADGPRKGLVADYVIITVELNDLEKGLSFLKNFLRTQKFPESTEIEYIKLNKIHTIKIYTP